MKLFADENIARALVVHLRARGNDVVYASEARPGAPDTDWLSRAEAEARVILTSDKDFGDLVFRDRMTSHGIVLLRLDDLTVTERLTRLDQVWETVESNSAGKFLVVSTTKVRIRDL